MSPCLRFRSTRRSRSPNSRWWKLDSPNQRSTRSGTDRASSAALSAAASVSARASSLSNVALPMASRVLTTMTVLLRTRGHRLRQRPEEERLAAARGRRCRGAHDHDVGALRPRAGWRCGRWRPRRTACSTWPSTCCADEMRQGPFRLRPDPSVRPARHEVEGDHRRPPLRWARASANRSASSAWGPPRIGTRTRRISAGPPCLTTAMSHGASRTTSSIVGEKTEAGLPRPCRRRLAGPTEDDQVRRPAPSPPR